MKKTIEIPDGYEARIEGNKVILERKESEEQMWALDVALENFYHSDDKAALESLRTDLQKLL